MTRRWPISSGRSGSARGERADQVGDRRARAAGLHLVEEEAAALVPEAVDDRRRDRRLAGGDPRQAPEHVGHHLADHRPAAVADPPRVPAQAPVARDQQRKAVAAVLEAPPDRVELRRRVEPGLVRLDQPQQAVALEVAVRPQPLVVGRDPRLGGRVADREPPRPGEQRRLDRAGHLGVARGDVVVDEPLPAQRLVPEDHVADEAVVAHRVQQAVELVARARRGRSGARRSPRSRSPSTTATGSGSGSGGCRSSGRRAARPRRARPRARRGSGRRARLNVPASVTSCGRMPRSAK